MTLGFDVSVVSKDDAAETFSVDRTFPPANQLLNQF
jgi:hypothetical protein